VVGDKASYIAGFVSYDSFVSFGTPHLLAVIAVLLKLNTSAGKRSMKNRTKES
jgi:hypothetical protein